MEFPEQIIHGHRVGECEYYGAILSHEATRERHKEAMRSYSVPMESLIREEQYVYPLHTLNTSNEEGPRSESDGKRLEIEADRKKSLEQTYSWKERITQLQSQHTNPEPEIDNWLTTLAQHYTDAVSRGEARPPHIDMEIATNLLEIEAEAKKERHQQDSNLHMF